MAVFDGQFSESVPFLKTPSNLDGSLPGDVGFDPLGFTEVFDVRVLREAELKHGRIAMLATLGYLVQEAYVFPFFDKVRPPLHCRLARTRSLSLAKCVRDRRAATVPFAFGLQGGGENIRSTDSAWRSIRADDSLHRCRPSRPTISS